MANSKKATKKAAKAPKAPGAGRAPLVEKNGIKRPKESGTTGQVWAAADRLTAKHGRPATRQEVVAECEKKGLSLGTAATQYQNWRLFNGIPSARRGAKPGAKPKAAPKAAKKAAKKAAPKKAAKAAKPAKPRAPKAPPSAPAAPAAEASASV